ncbi:M [Spodoptera frugiperda rhabdovirus]|uniref:M n=1 Tax=Spodoptera frugiperda rhabdovirus TaxID=1481139 RepID=X2KZF3_9RHAB|nr:M [Spodoptera frugiperda rhabdovirus] [Spodoptera frugiperda rhabdovirus]AHN92645.1 M [Spodoptera frugiperda rhabdovirus] [Spodoptera frugiperda rhabdovirus]QAS68966.1 M [Spodoptera frugiperda rhabdovirus] [Spodoptera frugiperda rhabdovirus]WKD80965.1 M [Spodoptera frugiperda rhabdovirus] [Spodoptera frugiperda rhabdovirus]WPA94108.1 putative matrix protein [Spodoptera frugiperda rhabdovirus]
MSALERIARSLSLKKLNPRRTPKTQPIPEKATVYHPFMLSYDLNLAIEGKIHISAITIIVNALSLAWAIELFHSDSSWSGCLEYFWKSIKDNILASINPRVDPNGTCHMMTSIITFLGFSDGSCINSEAEPRQLTGSRSWEIMSPNQNLIVITLGFKITLKTFAQHQRYSLRDHGFHKLEMLNEKEKKMLNYMGVKQLKPQYTHEKTFEKLILKNKGPKGSRVRAILHSQSRDMWSPTAPSPPPTYEDGSSDEWDQQQLHSLNHLHTPSVPLRAPRTSPPQQLSPKPTSTTQPLPQLTQPNKPQELSK